MSSSIKWNRKKGGNSDRLETSEYSLKVLIFLLILAISPRLDRLENKYSSKNNNKSDKNQKPRPDKKIQTKKRYRRKPAFNVPMEMLANTLQLNELPSVSPSDNFQKYVVAQN